jgi:ankyrin repeat protein
LLGAAGYGRIAMTQWLLERGADKSTTNFQNKTALDIAKQQENEELIALLS